MEPADTSSGEPQQECELFGLFGIFIQALLAFVCTMSLVVKKFLPTETRSWKVFCLDIWKQLLTAAFAHFLNLVLAVYLQDLTKSGNGCVWYLITLLLDVCLGTLIAYICFKIVDETAIRQGIEVSPLILLKLVTYLLQSFLGPQKRRLRR